MNASAASANDWPISSTCVIKSRWRLLVRSTITPAHADSRRIGPNWQADSAPTATPLPVRCRTSSVSATIVSQLPVFETVWPMKNSRKLRDPSDESVRRTKPRSVSINDVPLGVTMASPRRQMLCASRSINGTAARNCSSSAGENPLASACAIFWVRASRRLRSTSRPALVSVTTARRPSSASGRRCDETSRLERGERRAHRLRADLLALRRARRPWSGRRGRGGRAPTSRSASAHPPTAPCATAARAGRR